MIRALVGTRLKRPPIDSRGAGDRARAPVSTPSGPRLSKPTARSPGDRANLFRVYALLLALNLAAWASALWAFGGRPAMLGIGLVVYGLGLRHALDADHIASIDNVTRKLVQSGEHAASTGFWFAIGHSAVILLATAALVFAAGAIERLKPFGALGGVISAAASGVFLLFVAALNLCILRAIIRAIRSVRSGQAIDPLELDDLFAGGGVLSRLLRPLLGLVARPWHMAPLGFLFGLSFDTASEVALFGISAAQAADGAPLAAVLIYPLLFAAGMALLDTTDGVMMLGAYHWALADPLRKLRYNLTITSISVALALFIGTLEIGMLAVQLSGRSGWTGSAIARVAADMNHVGIAITIVFALAWLGSVVAFRRIRATGNPAPSPDPVTVARPVRP